MDKHKQQTSAPEQTERSFQTARSIVLGLSDALKRAVANSYRESGVFRTPKRAIRSAMRQAPPTRDLVDAAKQIIDQEQPRDSELPEGRIDQLSEEQRSRLLGNAQVTWMLWGLIAASSIAGFAHALLGTFAVGTLWRINILACCVLITVTMGLRMLLVARDVDVIQGGEPKPAISLLKEPAKWVPFDGAGRRDPVAIAYYALVLLLILHAPIGQLIR